MAERDDAELTAAVLAALRRNTFLRPLAIDVVVDDGVVTLSGSVESELIRQTAEREVRLIEGVKDVQNMLTVMGVESSSRSDEDIEREVREAMAADPTIDPGHFHVRSQFGRVIISGMAESYEEQESAIAAAKRVPGVEEVEDRTEVSIPMISEERGS